jgi:hypothetical protein
VPHELNPAVDRDLEAICMKCLARDSAQRYPSAAALADELTSYLNGAPLTVKPPRAWQLIWYWLRKNVRAVPNPRQGLAPVSVIALFEQVDSGDDRILIGLHASILQRRRLHVDPNLPEGWIEDRCLAGVVLGWPPPMRYTEPIDSRRARSPNPGPPARTSAARGGPPCFFALPSSVSSPATASP